MATGQRNLGDWMRVPERPPALDAASPSMARMVWEPLTGAVTWSDALYRLHGMRRGVDSVTFETFLERAHPEERDAFERLFSERLRTLEPFAVRHRIVRPDGRERLVEAHGRFVADDRGNLRRFELDVSYSD